MTLVSAVAETGSGETTYRVLVSFTPDHDVNFGMSVVVNTLDNDYPEDAEPARND